MREFKGILLTHDLKDKDERAREQKRLKSYLQVNWKRRMNKLFRGFWSKF